MNEIMAHLLMHEGTKSTRVLHERAISKVITKFTKFIYLSITRLCSLNILLTYFHV